MRVSVFRSTRILALPVAVAAVFVPPAAVAQSAKEYAIPADKLECLVENRDRYLDQPRAAFAFTPAACPKVGNEDISSTSMNIGGETEGTKRVFILRRDFLCLISRIGGYLAEHADSPANEKVITFTLDCPR